jgi:quercetin dioxygenase-like cupin family protein
MRWKLFCRAIFTSVILISSLAALSHTQTSAQSNPKLPTIGNCKPVNERTAEKGCWVLADQPVGRLETTQVFWHLDTYATRAAAEKAKGPRGTVIEALGKVWLMTIEAADKKEDGRPNERGERVAEIGPLPVVAGEQYAALFMESISAPGATSPAHTHPGPEAWYTAAGETCMETPAGKLVERAGAPGIFVPGATPMQLTVTGAVQRRAITLILYDSSKPPSTEIHDWTPKGLCKQ